MIDVAAGAEAHVGGEIHRCTGGASKTGQSEVGAERQSIVVGVVSGVDGDRRGSFREGECAERLRAVGSEAGVEIDRAAAGGDRSGVADAIVVADLEVRVVVEGQRREVQVDRRGVEDGAIFTQRERTAGDPCGTSVGERALHGERGVARVVHRDGARDRASIGLVALVRKDCRSRAGDGACTALDVTAAKAADVLVVAVEVERGADVDDYSLRREERIRPAAEGGSAAIQGLSAEDILGGRDIQSAAEVLAEATGAKEGAAEVQRGAAIDMDRTFRREADNRVQVIGAARDEDAAGRERQCIRGTDGRSGGDGRRTRREREGVRQGREREVRIQSRSIDLERLGAADEVHVRRRGVGRVGLNAQGVSAAVAGGVVTREGGAVDGGASDEAGRRRGRAAQLGRGGGEGHAVRCSHTNATSEVHRAAGVGDEAAEAEGGGAADVGDIDCRAAAIERQGTSGHIRGAARIAVEVQGRSRQYHCAVAAEAVRGAGAHVVEGQGGLVDGQRAGDAEGGTVAHGGDAAVEVRRAVPSVCRGTAQDQRARSRVGEDAESGRGRRRVALDQPGDRGRAGAGQSDGADVGIRADVEPTRESQAGVVVLQSAVGAGGATEDGREGQRISAIDQAHAAAETEDGTLRLGGDCGAGAEFATVEVEGGRREAESLRLVEDEDTLAEFTRAIEQVRGSAGDRRGGGIGRVDDQADVAIRCTGALEHAAEGGVACALDRERAGLSGHFRAVEVTRNREAASRSDRVVDRPRVARIPLDIAGDRDRIQTSEARLRVAGDLDRAVDGDAGGVGGIDRGVAEDDGSRADRAEGGGVVRAEGAAVDVQIAGEGVAGIGQFPRACVRLGDGQGTGVVD